MNDDTTIFIIAGEASGDAHGAQLIKNIRKYRPEINFFAMGSTQLQKAGAQLVIDSKDLAVVGFFEVLTKIRKIFQAFKKITHAIKKHQPDMIILIDYPGFNLRLAKLIKKRSPDIKIVFYISPQIWAWRYKRINIIKKYIDLMAVIFPFEVPIYKKAKIPVKYVGHPLTEKIPESFEISKIRCELELKEKSIVIGLMPGSRQSEIKSLLLPLLKTAEMLQKKYANIEFLLPLAPTLTENDLNLVIRNTNLKIKITKNDFYNAVTACDVIIVASGTATLEIAMLGKPMVIIYRGFWMTFLLAKYLVKIPYIGLCNIVAEELVVKELLQKAVTPNNIIKEVTQLLENDSYREQIIQKLHEIKEKMIKQNTSDRLEDIVLDMLPIKSVRVTTVLSAH